MPNKTNKNIYWAVKSPKGDIAPATIRTTRRASIAYWLGDSADWKEWYNYGWRCVRVKITEVK